jgi:NitT/TauT family transport system ATP-binding protein
MTLQGELPRLWQQGGFTTMLVTHDVEEAPMASASSSARVLQAWCSKPKSTSLSRHRDDPGFIALRRDILIALGHGEEL